MRAAVRIGVIAAAVLAGAASAQPPDLLDRLPPGFLPPGAVLGESFVCPDPAEPLTKPECCKVTVDIDAAGKAVRAEAKCTFAPLEAPMSQCELGRSHEPRITNAGPVPYSRTSFQEHYPTVRNASDLLAMQDAAKKACDGLR